MEKGCLDSRDVSAGSEYVLRRRSLREKEERVSNGIFWDGLLIVAVVLVEKVRADVLRMEVAVAVTVAVAMVLGRRKFPVDGRGRRGIIAQLPICTVINIFTSSILWWGRGGISDRP